MSTNEMEPSPIEELIEFETERSKKWAEILYSIKEEFENYSEITKRIAELTEDVSKIKNVLPPFESVSEEDKIKMVRESDIDIPSSKELNQFEIVGRIAKLFPEIEIAVPEGVKGVSEPAELEADIKPVVTIDMKDKLKKIGEELKGLKERMDKPEPILLLTEEWIIKELFNQGITLLKAGKIQNAYGYFANIVELNSKIREAWLNKGIIHGDAGEYEEEILCYNKALEIDENYAKALYNKGVALKKLYLFSWDDAPGNDRDRLLRSLRDDLDIGWADENARTLKFYERGKTIRIFTDENSAEIKIDEKKEKVTIKISDGRIYDLFDRAKEIDPKLIEELKEKEV